MARNRTLIAPCHWQRTHRYITDAYRVEFAKRRTGHWYGGPPTHKGAKCFVCSKPLRLVWDFDLSHKAFPNFVREAFGKPTRLPLYYCFNCPDATTYRVSSDASIRTIDPAGHDGGDETPYAYDANVPQQLPRKPLKLSKLPSLIEGLFTLESEIGYDNLDAQGQGMLSDYLGSRLITSGDVVFSQLGGSPILVQGDWDIECPNPHCATRTQYVYGESNRFMKKLAVVEQDAVSGFDWVYAPLAYYVCWYCSTIQGNFRVT